MPQVGVASIVLLLFFTLVCVTSPSPLDEVVPESPLSYRKTERSEIAPRRIEQELLVSKAAASRKQKKSKGKARPEKKPTGGSQTAKLGKMRGKAIHSLNAAVVNPAGHSATRARVVTGKVKGKSPRVYKGKSHGKPKQAPESKAKGKPPLERVAKKNKSKRAPQEKLQPKKTAKKTGKKQSVRRKSQKRHDTSVHEIHHQDEIQVKNRIVNKALQTIGTAESKAKEGPNKEKAAKLRPPKEVASKIQEKSLFEKSQQKLKSQIHALHLAKLKGKAARRSAASK